MAEEMAQPFQETLDRQQSIRHVMQGEQQYEVTVPGLSAAVILPDGTTWRGVSGKSSDNKAMNSDMLFGLASVTKTYIAALVAELVEEGALSAEDPIGEWIPNLGEINEDITIRQLLNHTSGLYSVVTPKNWTQKRPTLGDSSR
jgi:CubicO group peptidase (beta-lactamase class C family)